jgi:N-acyl homoserine lactone hydrolase
VIPLHMGHYTTPASGERFPNERIVVTAFLIEHPRGLFLFDTGGSLAHRSAVELHSPVDFRPIPDVLREHGLAAGDVRLVANCHFHTDHAGGNHHFPGRPIFAQRHEVAHARATDDFTHLPSVADFSGARIEELDGEAEPLPGIRILATPGHTPGHQSVVVETRKGRVVLAGQALSFSSDYARHRYSHELALRGEAHGPYPDWIARLQELDPWRVYFAHDRAHWQRDALAPFG